jgi:DNA-directed RNA polymerase subunit RPC12/RpoP
MKTRKQQKAERQRAQAGKTGLPFAVKRGFWNNVYVGQVKAVELWEQVGEYPCIDCGEEGLTFDGPYDEKIYEADEETGEKRCWTCDRKANPEKYEHI